MVADIGKPRLFFQHAPFALWVYFQECMARHRVEGSCLWRRAECAGLSKRIISLIFFFDMSGHALRAFPVLN